MDDCQQIHRKDPIILLVVIISFEVLITLVIGHFIGHYYSFPIINHHHHFKLLIIAIKALVYHHRHHHLLINLAYPHHHLPPPSLPLTFNYFKDCQNS